MNQFKLDVDAFQSVTLVLCASECYNSVSFDEVTVDSLENTIERRDLFDNDVFGDPAG